MLSDGIIARADPRCGRRYNGRAVQCLSDDAVLDWIEGRLESPTIAAAEEHLEACEECRALVAAAASTPGDRAALLPPGTELGRYIILSVRGAGAMGVVYAAQDKELGRKVALKVLRTDGARQAAAEERILSQEALTLAKLSHPNVVTVYDVAILDGKLAIAMELVEGLTMREWLDERAHSPAEVLTLLLQAGAGLSAAHAVGIVHRDFKPDNVLIGSDGRARVGDFGLARHEAAGRDPAIPLAPLGPSLAGRVVGTPGYMAPEQLAALPVDARADVFAFCVAAWEAYFGARPFSGQTTTELATAIGAGAPPRRAWPLGVAAGVERGLRAGLAADRLARSATISAVLASLAAAHRRPRRIRTALAAVVLLVFLGVAQRYVRAPACDDSVAAWGDAWTPARRAKLTTALVATGRPRAAEIAARVTALFDRHASGWQDAHKQVCGARTRGTSSIVLADQQALCLARQRHETAAMAELLTRPEADNLDDIMTAALRLPDAGSCLRAPSLLLMMPPPRDPASLAALDRIEKTMGAAAAARSAHRWPECVAASQSSIAGAQKLGYAPLLAQAYLLLGHCIEYTDKLARAEASLHDAATAAQRGGDQRTLALAWTRLMFLAGYERRQFAESDQWARYARAVIDRLGDDDDLEYRWALNLGLVHSRSGAADVEALMIRARQAAERRFGTGSIEAQAAAGALANLYLDIGDPERALPIHRALLAAEKALSGPWHRGSITTLINITLELLMLKRHAEALVIAEELMALSQAQPGNWDDHWTRQTYASALRANGRSTEALEHDRAAASTCEKLLGEHWDCAFALAGHGLDLLALHRPREAVAPLEAAYRLRAHDEAPDPEMTMALAHALWESGGDRPRALQLGRAALRVQRRTTERAPTPVNREKLADINRWLVQVGA